MTVYTTSEAVAGEIAARMALITKENGFETDIGKTAFEGRIAVNDDDVPCVSVIEGDDSVISTPGRVALWKLEQNYALVGYSECDPAHPGRTARAIIRDLKRAVFKTNGKADATFGGKVLEVHYKGRNIGPRADGAAIVMAIVEIAVVFIEQVT